MLPELIRNLRNSNQASKEYFLKNDIDLTSIILGGAIILVPPMSYLDYTYYGFSTDFYLTAALEGLFILFSGLVIFFIQHNCPVKRYERLVFAWNLVLAIAALFAVFLQPARIIENAIICELVLIAIYFLMANTFSFRIIPAGIITIGCILALLATHTAASGQQQYLLTLTMLLLNAVGILIVARNNRFKRIEYESQNREREARKMFEALAASDPLTGILNHRSFRELAQLALNRFMKSNDSFCLAIFDLDHLKQINDTHGHLAGDEALKRFTSMVTSKKRLTDIFGRIGGDEFGFILPRVTQTDALKVLSRIRKAMQALTIPSPVGNFKISFSAGITDVRPEDKTLDDLIHRADQVLYESKDKGGDRMEASWATVE